VSFLWVADSFLTFRSSYLKWLLHREAFLDQPTDESSQTAVLTILFFNFIFLDGTFHSVTFILFIDWLGLALPY